MFQEQSVERMEVDELPSSCSKEKHSSDSNQVAFLTPDEAITLFTEELNNYEKEEIKAEYQQIYCVGSQAKKRERDGVYNNKFSTRTASYATLESDHIAYRYEVMELLGSGVSGKVYRVFDHKDKKYLALKCYRYTSKYIKIAKSEEQLLRYIESLDDQKGRGGAFPKILNSFEFRRHRILAFELLGPNMLEVQEKYHGSLMPLDELREHALSLLAGLELLAEQKIIHGDIKAENVLLNVPGPGVTLIDFGAGCFQDKQIHTYLQSRYYRAPEVLLGLKYTPAIDIWSFGCLLAEMYTGEILLAGKNENDQLRLISKMCCIPNVVIEKSKVASRELYQGYFRSEGSELRNYDLRPNKTKPTAAQTRAYLKSALRDCQNDHFVDLLARCLTVNVSDRISPTDALAHPFFRRQ